MSKKRTTQKEKVLNHLIKNRSITPIQALNKYGVFRLAAVVRKLKDCGYIIGSERVSKDGKSFAKYTWGKAA